MTAAMAARAAAAAEEGDGGAGEGEEEEAGESEGGGGGMEVEPRSAPPFAIDSRCEGGEGGGDREDVVVVVNS